ncbi:hypothetical protein F511_20052 [Dorcoceras hygrometricum]|uniref:Uncharacterized protein n=1 Tax=Dorcoceras hygrometricum TaxID=472368 RepID=A0A2Z7D974_9LAMI|nr:hypothetical protein F511_20052 [Dorcoceras hygrometricum]
MLSLYYGWNWHGYCVFVVYALHCCFCVGLTVAFHTHYHSIQLLQPCPVVIAVMFLPDFEGERQYHTLISLLLLSVLRFDPVVPLGLLCCLPVCGSGFSGFSAGRGFDPAGAAPGGR